MSGLRRDSYDQLVISVMGEKEQGTVAPLLCISCPW